MSSTRYVQAPGYTQIPNELLDELLPECGTLAELKVVMAIARRTFGWGINERRLSLTEIQELAGLSRQSTQTGLTAALDRGFLARRREGHGFVYGIPIATAKKVGSCPPGEESRSATGRVQDLDQGHNEGKKTLRGKEKQPGADAPSSAKKSKRKAADLYQLKQDDPVDVVISEIFEGWRTGTGRNGASTLTVHRAGQIRARLKEAAGGAEDPSDLTIALAHARGEVLEAVAGMVGSKWHRENGQQEFDQLFRKRDRIEAFVKRYHAEGGSTPDFAEYDGAIEANPELEAQ